MLVQDAFATRPMSPADNVIVFSSYADFAYFDEEGKLHVTVDLPVLAHEVYHVRYYTENRQLFGFVKAPMSLNAAGDQILGWMRGRSPYDYTLVDGKAFSSYTAEQRAQIVQDCYRGVGAACGVSPYQPGYDATSIAFESRGTFFGWWK